MADVFSPVSIEFLAKWIFEEEKTGTIFGISKNLFFKPEKCFSTKLFGHELATPLGVAAGPHTQMAQNIISAWLCGARFIELKTVQTLDKLVISKPCIDMEDEGYNCEWSQELTLEESFDEYLNAWILIHVLNHHLGFGKNPGTIFNMSLGYNMSGILEKNVQDFIDKMEDCSEQKARKIKLLSGIIPDIESISIPGRITNSVTLSTMHGCPPQEIETIGLYLIERGFHTTIKLNPTLLGADELRKILNTKLGFKTLVPDEAFAHDLKYSDALKIIKNLKNHAEKNSVEFCVKLANTLESLNKKGVLPVSEQMNYMSGRAIHPITTALAYKIEKDFNGELPVSFSGGADSFNFTELLKCGMKTVTVCSDILRPGGYLRLGQYLENLKNEMNKYNAITLDDFLHKTGIDSGFSIVKNLEKYLEKVLNAPEYKRGFYEARSIKTSRKLNGFDCIKAPCVETCPAHQSVPGYMFSASNCDYDGALNIILGENPLPIITGKVCDHLCMTKCTRQNIDVPLRIRDIKRFVAENREHYSLNKVRLKTDKKVAVIGAGPAGLSCSYFLAKAGISVTVFEKELFSGGLAGRVIPDFRINGNDILKDVLRIKSLGVDFKFGTEINNSNFEEIVNNFDAVFVANGAGAGKKIGINGENLPGVFDALSFLSAMKDKEKNKEIEVFIDSLKKKELHIAVIGGGNSAMDAARSALRIEGHKNHVSILYRRTINEMPADKEELFEAQKEGALIAELIVPLEIAYDKQGLRLNTCRMKLGEKDFSGRARPEKIEGSEEFFSFDIIILALGQHSDCLLKESSDNVKIFVGGDARTGAATIIKAIADGKSSAEKISNKFGIELESKPQEKFEKNEKLDLYQKKMAYKDFGKTPEIIPFSDQNRAMELIKCFSESDAVLESSRCLICSERCDICVSVCPNRANISVVVEPKTIMIPMLSCKGSINQIDRFEPFSVKQKFQVINISDFCNECGNCATFCPTDGKPYKEKYKLSLSENSFKKEDTGYLLISEGEKTYLKYKNNEKISALIHEGEIVTYASDDIKASFNAETFDLVDIYFSCKTEVPDMREAGEMFFMLKGLKSLKYLL